MAIHINNWIKNSDPDYYIMFIKAWIPLNAWYVDKYPEHNANDSAIITELINKPNDIKKFINSLLIDTDKDYKKFCHHLSELHLELEKKSLTHKNNNISFKSMYFGQYKCSPYNYTDSDGINFQASQPNSIENVFKVQIVKGKKNYLIVKNTSYDIEHLKAHNDFVGLENEQMRQDILKCYIAINPNQYETVITCSKNKGEYILLDNNKKSKFKNEPEIISRFIIKILYVLRCKLFHGEIDPNENNSVVYEHAFYVLKLIINKIK